MGRQSDAIMATIRAHVAEVRTDALLEVTAALVEATPVDTGFAAASWVPSIGEPLDLAAPIGDVGAANAQREAAIAGVLAAPKDDLRDGHVFNPTDYIEFLNGGSSDQAPAQFVERALEQGIAATEAKLITPTVKL